MKRYKKLLFQVGILLFVCAVFIFILEQQKKFITIDVSKQYESNKTIELSGFEQTENWQGNYSYDSVRVLEGKTSLTLTSWYGKETTIEKESRYSLRDGYTKGYISLFIPDKEKLDALTSLKLILISEKQKQEYNLTSQLNVGWNRAVVVIPAWKYITSIAFSIVSKSGDITEVNLDRFWIENSTIYTSDVVESKSKALSLRTIGERTYLFVSSTQMESFRFVEPEKINRGSVTISLIPEHTKRLRISLNGTTVEIDGSTPNTCVLYENGKLIKKAVLGSTKALDDLYVYVKAELSNNKILYSISNNGITYEQCGILSTSANTQIELGLQGSYLIDSYSVEY